MKIILFLLIFVISTFSQSNILDIVLTRISENILSEEIDEDITNEVEDYLNNPIFINDPNLNLDNLWFIDQILRDSITSIIKNGNYFYNKNELLNHFNFSEEISIFVYFVRFDIIQREEYPFSYLLSNNYNIKSSIVFNTPTSSKIFFKERQINNLKVSNDFYKLNLFTKAEKYNNYNSNYGLELNPNFIINKIIFGDFRLRFGNGLVLSNSYLPGRFDTYKKKYKFNNNAELLTNNSNNFFRGLYSQMDLSLLSISFFYKDYKKNYQNNYNLLQTGFIITPNIDNNYNLAFLIMNNNQSDNNNNIVLSITNELKIDKINLTGEYSFTNNKLSIFTNLYYHFSNLSFIINFRKVYLEEMLISKSHQNENSVTIGLSHKVDKIDLNIFYNHTTFDSQLQKYQKNILVEGNYRINKNNRIKIRYQNKIENKLIKNDFVYSYENINEGKIKLSLHSKLNENINIKTAVGSNIKEIKNNRSYFFEQNLSLTIADNFRFKFNLFIYNTLSELYSFKTFEENLDGQYYFNEYFKDGYKISTILELNNNLLGILSFRILYWKTSQTTGYNLSKLKDGLNLGLQYSLKL